MPSLHTHACHTHPSRHHTRESLCAGFAPNREGSLLLPSTHRQATHSPTRALHSFSRQPQQPYAPFSNNTRTSDFLHKSTAGGGDHSHLPGVCAGGVSSFSHWNTLQHSPTGPPPSRVVNTYKLSTQTEGASRPYAQHVLMTTYSLAVRGVPTKSHIFCKTQYWQHRFPSQLQPSLDTASTVWHAPARMLETQGELQTTHLTAVNGSQQAKRWP